MPMRGVDFKWYDGFFLSMLATSVIIVSINWKRYRLCAHPLHIWIVVDYTTVFIFRLLMFLDNGLAAGMGLDLGWQQRYARFCGRIFVLSVLVLLLYPFLWVWTVIGTLWFSTARGCLPEEGQKWGFLIWLLFSYCGLACIACVAIGKWLNRRHALQQRAQQGIPVSEYGVLVDMIRVPDWAFEAVGLEMRVGLVALSVSFFGRRLHMPTTPRSRSQASRTTRPWILSGMDFADSRRKPNFTGKIAVAAALTVMCIIVLKQSPSFSGTSVFSRHENGVTHVLVTGGAGYIGSHATLRLLSDKYRVTIVDNLSRGNMGAVKVLQRLFPEPGRLQFIYADLGDAKAVNKIFSENAFDAVMHFAAVAYVGESTMEPLRYYHNITSNTLTVLEAMAAHNVNTLIYSSTCATYGEPDTMPIVETTPQNPINPYGKAKKMAEDIILDFTKSKKQSNMAVMILRYFNVIGSDPEGRLGEAPRPELREHGRISGACFDAALGIIPGLKVRGTNYPTADGTCIRDYIDVTDLVDAHVKALDKAQPGKVGIYNVGTGQGRSVNEFVKACMKATGASIKVEYLARRPGDYAEVYSDPSKIHRDLNWTAQYTDLGQSLAQAWKWQKAHPNGYGSA